MIYGERLRQARELLGLTQQQLVAEIAGLNQPRLSRAEKNEGDLAPEMVTQLAQLSGLRDDFFSRPPDGGLTTTSLRYRATSSLTERERKRSRRWAELVLEQSRRLSAEFEERPPTLDRRPDLSPASASRLIRDLIGRQPDEPLPYLLLELERLGVVALGLPQRGERHDAFCGWRDGRPVLALLADAPGDRQRFSIAHELGHILLHDDGSRHVDAEREADEFAAELLVPAAAIRSEMPANPRLGDLQLLKARWGVSLRTLTRQGKRVGVIDADRYTSIFRQLSARGWSRAEPVHVSVERPRAFRKMFELVYGDRGQRAFADDAGWDVNTVALVMDQHASDADLPIVPDRTASAATSTNVVQLHTYRTQTGSS